MAEIIQLTTTSRLVVEQDSDAEAPRGGDFGALTGFVKLGEYGDSRRISPPAVHAPPFDFATLYYKLVNRRPFQPHTDIMYRHRAQDRALVERWARICCGLEIVFDHDYGGWWFRAYDADESGDRTDQLEAIAADRALYETWASGDVWQVMLQRLQTYVRVQDAESDTDNVSDVVDFNDQIEIWKDVDGGALAGCYLDEEYTAQKVALEHFPLTADEKAGAEGGFPPGDLDAEEQ